MNGVQILLLVQEQVNDQVATFRVVEEDKQRPVDEPGSLLESLQAGAEHTLVDELPQSKTTFI